MSKALRKAIKDILMVQMIQFGLTDIKRMMITVGHTTALNIKINMVYHLMT